MLKIQQSDSVTTTTALANTPSSSSSDGIKENRSVTNFLFGFDSEDKLSILVKAAEKLVNDEKVSLLENPNQHLNVELNDMNGNVAYKNITAGNIDLTALLLQNNTKILNELSANLTKLNSFNTASSTTSSSSADSTTSNKATKNGSNDNSNYPVFIGKNGKPTRPFKAFSKETLAMPIGSTSTPFNLQMQNTSINNNIYNNQPIQLSQQQQQLQTSPVNLDSSNSVTTEAVFNMAKVASLLSFPNTTSTTATFNPLLLNSLSNNGGNAQLLNTLLTCLSAALSPPPPPPQTTSLLTGENVLQTESNTNVINLLASLLANRNANVNNHNVSVNNQNPIVALVQTSAQLAATSPTTESPVLTPTTSKTTVITSTLTTNNNAYDETSKLTELSLGLSNENGFDLAALSLSASTDLSVQHRKRIQQAQERLMQKKLQETTTSVASTSGGEESATKSVSQRRRSATSIGSGGVHKKRGSDVTSTADLMRAASPEQSKDEYLNYPPKKRHRIQLQQPDQESAIVDSLNQTPAKSSSNKSESSDEIEPTSSLSSSHSISSMSSCSNHSALVVNNNQQQSALALLKASLYSPAAPSNLCGSSPSPLANGTNFVDKVKQQPISVSTHDICSDTSSNGDSSSGSNNNSSNNHQNRSMELSNNALDRSDSGNTMGDSYKERRRKNNEAAKRSRDARRAKEDDIALRAALLERENLQLKVELTQLKQETHRLRCLLYNS